MTWDIEEKDLHKKFLIVKDKYQYRKKNKKHETLLRQGNFLYTMGIWFDNNKPKTVPYKRRYRILTETDKVKRIINHYECYT